jgi:hypothetical protein
MISCHTEARLQLLMFVSPTVWGGEAGSYPLCCANIFAVLQEHAFSVETP